MHIPWLLLGLVLWLPQATASNPEDVTSQWYAIEVIVFQRSGTAEANSEHLNRVDGRSFPNGIRTFLNDAAWDGYRLSPFTQANLRFSTPSYARRPGDTAAAPSRTSTSARYSPATASSSASFPCGPGAERLDAANPARVEAWGPAPLDTPVAPEQPRVVCGQPTGSPPPAITPVLEPHPLLAWLSAVRRFENQSLAASYRTSLRGAMLRRSANRLSRAGDMKLLWHGRWTQPVPSREAPEPLLIQAGRRTGDIYELEGALGITKGRYLHFHAQLWLHDTLATATDFPASATPQAEESTAEPGTGEPGAPAHPAAYMVLDESRAMRSAVLHYLDHPRLGVLVRADPVEPPDWLVDASAALEFAEFGD